MSLRLSLPPWRRTRPWLGATALAAGALALGNVALAAPPSHWQVDGAAKRLDLTLTPSGVGEQLADFPVAVRLNADRIDYAVADRDHLTFTAGEDDTPLPYQVETWNPAGESIVWVKAPRVAAGEQLSLYYGAGAPASAVAATDVWDQDFLTVQHLDDSAAPTADATSNGVSGTATDAPAFGAAGQLGTAAQFDGDDDALDFGAVGDGAQDLTVSTWVYISDATMRKNDIQGIVARDDTGGLNPQDRYLISLTQSTSNKQWDIRTYTTGGEVDISSSAATTPALVPRIGWHHVAITHDRQNFRAYVDGALLGEAPAIGTRPTGAIGRTTGGSTAETPLTLGTYSNRDNFGELTIDELRLGGAARSAGWIRAEYLAGTDALVAYGATDTPDGETPDEPDTPDEPQTPDEPDEPETPAGWAVASASKRIGLSFDVSELSGELSDFPVAVHLTPARINYALAARDRLTFLAGDDATPLSYEVESWDPTGESIVWVKAPQVGAGERLWMYYGPDAPASTVTATDVWNQDFLTVQHLGDAAAPTSDATTNGISGQKHDEPTFGVAGQLGKAVKFDGSGGNLDFGVFGDTEPDLSVSTWVYINDAALAKSGLQGVIARDDTGGTNVQDRFLISTDSGKWDVRTYTGTRVQADAQVPMTKGWHHVALTHDRQVLRVYVDGRMIGEAPAVGTRPVGVPAGASRPSTPLTLGSYSNLGNPGNFTIDETRIGRTARSADWMKAEYLTGSDQLVRYSPSQSIDGALEVSLSSPTATTESADGEVTVSGLVTAQAEVSYRLDGAAPVSLGTTDDAFTTRLLGLHTGTHTLEVTAVGVGQADRTSTASVSFAVVGTAAPSAPSAPQPADGTTGVGSSATLSVQVGDPTGDPLDVSFRRAEAHHVAAGDLRSGTTTGGPAAQAFDGDVLGTTDVNAVAASDDQRVVSTDDDSSVYQRFDVAVGAVAAGQTALVTWEGRADRIVVLYGWNFASGRWVEVGSGTGATPDSDFTIEAEIDPATMVSGGKARLLAYRGIAPNPLNSRRPVRGEYDFNTAWFTDPQYMAEGYPDHFNDMTTDIVDTAAAKNTKYVFTTGDNVQTRSVISEWEKASTAFRILDDARIPYGILPGNHDNDGSSAESAHSTYYRYFGEARYSDNPWYGASYKNNENHYDLFSAGGLDFVVVYLGYGVDEDEVEWANDVLQANADRRAIVATHDYMFPDGTIEGRLSTRSDDPLVVEQGVVIPNRNVFMTLSGHTDGAVRRLRIVNGHTVLELEHDYQRTAEGGMGYYRDMRFDTQNGLFYVSAYSPVTGQYNLLGERFDQYVMHLDAIQAPASQRRLETDAVKVVTAASEQIGSVADVASGARAELAWTGLEPGTDYAWQASVRDASGNIVASDIWTFTTGGESTGGDDRGGDDRGGDERTGGDDRTGGPGPIVDPGPIGTPGPGPGGPAPGDSQPPVATPAVVRHSAGIAVSQLHVVRASRRLQLTGTIARAARGGVQGTYVAGGKSTRFTLRLTGSGRFSLKVPLTPAQARAASGRLTLRYAGDTQVRAQTLTLRTAAASAAKLTVKTVAVKAGRLSAAGTIAAKATGPVALQLEWVSGGVERSRTVRATIRRGRWAASVKLPADVAASIAGRSGDLSATVSYAGNGRVAGQSVASTVRVSG